MTPLPIDRLLSANPLEAVETAGSRSAHSPAETASFNDHLRDQIHTADPRAGDERTERRSQPHAEPTAHDPQPPGGAEANAPDSGNTDGAGPDQVSDSAEGVDQAVRERSTAASRDDEDSVESAEAATDSAGDVLVDDATKGDSTDRVTDALKQAAVDSAEAMAPGVQAGPQPSPSADLDADSKTLEGQAQGDERLETRSVEIQVDPLSHSTRGSENSPAPLEGDVTAESAAVSSRLATDVGVTALPEADQSELLDEDSDSGEIEPAGKQGRADNASRKTELPAAESETRPQNRPHGPPSEQEDLTAQAVPADAFDEAGLEEHDRKARERAAPEAKPTSGIASRPGLKTAADRVVAESSADMSPSAADGSSANKAADSPSGASAGASSSSAVGGMPETPVGRTPGQVLARGHDRTTTADRISGAQQTRLVHRVARAFRAAQDRGGEVRIRLSPPELGSLKIEVRVEAGVMTARLEAETHGARNALLDNLPALRDRLAEQNVRVEQFDVDVTDRRGGELPNMPDRQAAGSRQSSESRAATRPGGEEEPSVDQPRRVPGPQHDGGINVMI